MKTYELTFKRLNGEIEKIETTKFPKMTDNIFNQIKVANLNAGRGELLSCEDVTVQQDSKKNKPSRPTVCPKCGTYCYGDCEAN